MKLSFIKMWLTKIYFLSKDIIPKISNRKDSFPILLSIRQFTNLLLKKTWLIKLPFFQKVINLKKFLSFKKTILKSMSCKTVYQKRPDSQNFLSFIKYRTYKSSFLFFHCRAWVSYWTHATTRRPNGIRNLLTMCLVLPGEARILLLWWIEGHPFSSFFSVF